MTQNTNQLIQETMESYYVYVVKIESGCNSIIQSLKANEVAVAMGEIITLSEGLDWLLEAEYLLEKNSYKIDSPIAQISPLFERINTAIETNNIEEVIDLFETDFKNFFAKASDWKFEEVIS